jgi:hypothetical protein
VGASRGVVTGKRLIRQKVAADLREKVEDLRKTYPTLSTSELLALARKKDTALFAYAARIENGDWSSAGGFGASISSRSCCTTSTLLRIGIVDKSLLSDSAGCSGNDKVGKDKRSPRMVFPSLFN